MLPLTTYSALLFLFIRKIYSRKYELNLIFYLVRDIIKAILMNGVQK